MLQSCKGFWLQQEELLWPRAGAEAGCAHNAMACCRCFLCSLRTSGADSTPHLRGKQLSSESQDVPLQPAWMHMELLPVLGSTASSIQVEVSSPHRRPQRLTLALPSSKQQPSISQQLADGQAARRDSKPQLPACSITECKATSADGTQVPMTLVSLRTSRRRQVCSLLR